MAAMEEIGIDEPVLCSDLEFWMTRLPPRLRNLPIIQLAIPGSHNSMTYTIERHDDVGPDESLIVRFLARCCSPLVKPIIVNWSINQHESIKDQLNGGIRYLDLRLAAKPNDQNIYFVHGLYGAEISEPLQDVVQWLSDHPREILILDFQHFYDFTEDHHRSLIKKINYMFRGKMCPPRSNCNFATLQMLNSERYQVIVIYRNIIIRNFPNLWPSGLWPTPWPDTVSTNHLVDFLDEGLKSRVTDVGFVSQCLLTPNASYVLTHPCGNLQRDLGTICRHATMSWIQENQPGRGGMNVVITDYVSTQDFFFSKSVIQRNVALLDFPSSKSPVF